MKLKIKIDHIVLLKHLFVWYLVVIVAFWIGWNSQSCPSSSSLYSMIKLGSQNFQKGNFKLGSQNLFMRNWDPEKFLQPTITLLVTSRSDQFDLLQTFHDMVSSQPENLRLRASLQNQIISIG